MHSIENTGVTNADFRLTSEMVGVKPHSFFESFQGCPVGGESGAEANSLGRACSARLRGIATVDSEPPVERNRKSSKARWNPEALNGSSG